MNTLKSILLGSAILLGIGGPAVAAMIWAPWVFPVGFLLFCAWGMGDAIRHKGEEHGPY